MCAPARRAFILSVMLFGYIGVCTAAEEPAYRNAVFQPSFYAGGKRYVSGKGFVTTFNGRDFFITALHLIGRPGGFSRDYVGSEVAGVVDRMEAFSIDDRAVHIVTSTVLTLADTEPMSSSSVRGDVAAFILKPDNDYVKLPLATTFPEKGEVLWMLSSVFGGEKKIHKATVTGSGIDGVVYRFEDSDIKLGATSGAPLVNAKGEVVAINIGAKYLIRLVIGTGNPAVSIRRHLADGLAKTR